MVSSLGGKWLEWLNNQWDIELRTGLPKRLLRASNAESSPFWSLPPATSRKKTLPNDSAITWKRLNADITIMN